MGATASHRWAARTAIAGTVFIALSAFWLSFTALADLAARSGIARNQAWAWPLIVDGIIVVATVSVVALAGQRTAWYPWMLLAGGALISVTANAVHAVVSADADVPDVLAAAVAAVPPVVLLAITHLTVILTRTPTEEPQATAPIVEIHQASEHLEETAISRADAVRELEHALGDVEPGIAESGVRRRERAELLRREGWSNKQIAKQLAVHPSTVGRWFARAHPSTDSASDVEGEES